MGLKLITPPTEFPVTLAEAKAQCNINVSDYDGLITRYIGSATAEAEVWLGRALIDQTWELMLDEFPPNELRIPKPPLIEILDVFYDDTTGNEATLATTEYIVDMSSEPGWIVPQTTWPATFDGINAVRIQFRAGYLDQSGSPLVQNVPDDIRHAILLAVGDAFDNRGTIVVGLTVSRTKTWENLLQNYRSRLAMA